MSIFVTFILMIIFFLFIEMVASLFALDEHKTITPEPWDISGENERRVVGGAIGEHHEDKKWRVIGVAVGEHHELIQLSQNIGEEE